MTGPGVLLLVDYPGYRRGSRLSDLGLERHGHRTEELLRPPLPTDPADYAGALLRARGRPAAPVLAVLGNCASAPVACRVRTLLAGPDAAPALVLFDPEVPTPASVEAECRALLKVVDGDAGLPPPGFDPLATVAERLGTGLPEQLRLDGCPEDEAAETTAQMVRSALDWLRHLLAAGALGLRPGPGGLLVVRSRGGDPPVPGGGVRDVVVDGDPDRLLARAGTRDAVLRFLSGPG